MKIFSLSSNDSKKPIMDDLIKIYSHAIPASERKSREKIEKALATPGYYFYVLTHHDHTIGFAIIFAPSYSDYCLLEYIAVEKTKRNRGYGSKLFMTLTEIFAKKTMLIEVDSPYQQSEDQDLRIKRLRFYTRLNCLTVTGLKYILPLATNGIPPDMLLLIHSKNDANGVPKEKLLSWITDIYVAVYGCNKADPRLPEMFSELPSIVTLLK